MRILLTTDTVGGVWTFTRELTAELLRRGHAVALVSFGREPSLEQSVWCSNVQIAHPDIFCYQASALPLEWMSGNDVAYSSAEPLLLRIARHFEPDIFHSNQFCFGRLPVECPQLITAHSDVLSWAEACRPAGLEPSPWLAQYVDLVSDGLQGADAVVAPTQWMLDALGDHFSIECEGAVISNGLSLPTAPLGNARKLQAVSAGRLWDEAKNIGLLGKVDAPLPILVAGDTKHEAASTAEHLGAAFLLGSLPEEALLALFRASSIYIATSIYEPFGLAPLEAAMCGCAVLANDIPSLREVWGDAAHYFGDAASLTALLRALADSSDHLRVAQRRSQARATQYTATRMTDEYLRLYERLVAAKSTALTSQELLAHAS